MRLLMDIVETSLAAILMHPLRSAVTVACVVAVLVPYLAGIGVSTGVLRDAEMSVQYGADLFVTGSQFGRQVPVPLESVNLIQAMEGVVSVTPRIVCPVTLGREHLSAVLVGIPTEALPESVQCVQGRLFHDGRITELVVGSRLASRLRLRPGDYVPPFYRSPQGDRVSQVVGIFHAGVSLWEANLMFTSLESAAAIFDQPGQATEFLVRCRPGYADAVRDQITRTVSFPTGDPQRSSRPQVTTRQELLAKLPVGLLHREGIFNLHFLVAFVVGMLAVLVTSGFGLSERRREIGILKALGWQTDEVLLRSLVESFLLSLLGASLAIVIAYVWLEWFRGYWIAGVFLFGIGSDLEARVPFLLTPLPALLAFMVSFVMVMSGTLFSTWRAATVPPWIAMQR